MHHDKTIRRRRAVLALLVAASLVLLTASFGDSASGGAGTVQRGVFGLVSPIQDGASSALKPVRDLFGWFGDTLHAKKENKRLRAERDQAILEAVDADALRLQNQQFRGELKLDRTYSLDQLGPVSARVTGKSASVLNQTITINKGTSDGIRLNQPVVTAAGLVGRITVVDGGHAKVTLLTDKDFGAQAKIAESGAPGDIKPAAGAPRELRLEGTTADAGVAPGQRVVTSGTAQGADLPSLFPPDIPIGKVTKVVDPGTDDPEVHVVPYVDMRRVDYVQVLTDMARAARS